MTIEDYNTPDSTGIRARVREKIRQAPDRFYIGHRAREVINEYRANTAVRAAIAVADTFGDPMVNDMFDAFEVAVKHIENVIIGENKPDPQPDEHIIVIRDPDLCFLPLGKLDGASAVRVRAVAATIEEWQWWQESWAKQAERMAKHNAVVYDVVRGGGPYAEWGRQHPGSPMREYLQSLGDNWRSNGAFRIDGKLWTP